MKKPSDFIGEKAIYDEHGQIIFASTGDDIQMFLDLRGWGRISKVIPNLTEATKFQDNLGKWVVDAINEKLERERNGN